MDFNPHSSPLLLLLLLLLLPYNRRCCQLGSLAYSTFSLNRYVADPACCLATFADKGSWCCCATLLVNQRRLSCSRLLLAVRGISWAEI